MDFERKLLFPALNGLVTQQTLCHGRELTGALVMASFCLWETLLLRILAATALAAALIFIVEKETAPNVHRMCRVLLESTCSQAHRGFYARANTTIQKWCIFLGLLFLSSLPNTKTLCSSLLWHKRVQRKNIYPALSCPSMPHIYLTIKQLCSPTDLFSLFQILVLDLQHISCLVLSQVFSSSKLW